MIMVHRNLKALKHLTVNIRRSTVRFSGLTVK